MGDINFDGGLKNMIGSGRHPLLLLPTMVNLATLYYLYYSTKQPTNNLLTFIVFHYYNTNTLTGISTIIGEQVLALSYFISN